MICLNQIIPDGVLNALVFKSEPKMVVCLLICINQNRHTSVHGMRLSRTQKPVGSRSRRTLRLGFKLIGKASGNIPYKVGFGRFCIQFSAFFVIAAYVFRRIVFHINIFIVCISNKPLHKIRCFIIYFEIFQSNVSAIAEAKRRNISVKHQSCAVTVYCQIIYVFKIKCVILLFVAVPRNIIDLRRCANIIKFRFPSAQVQRISVPQAANSLA